MRRPTVATVLTAQPWEEAFVALARRTGTVRIVTRAYRPDEVAVSGADVAVVGEETSWLDADVVGLWAALGVKTVVVTRGQAGPADIPRSTAEPTDILETVQRLWLDDARQSELISVVGPSGSGVTEIACALAGSWAPVHVVDQDAPAAILRLNLAGDRTGPVTVSPDFPIEPPERLIVDCGDRGPLPAGRCVLVVAHTPISFVRAARLVALWTGPVPRLVLNMVRDDSQAAACAMANLGLEPSLLLPYDPEVATRAARGEPPREWLTARVARLLTPADDPVLG